MNPAPRVPDPALLLRQALPGDEPAPPWPAPSLTELAAAFPELVLHEQIGQGGMAAVYRATQARMGRAVALKVMRPDLAAKPQFAERFVREARALATLSDPHVLAIHDVGERAGFCYLVTEYVDGANLRELMQLGRLSPSEVLRLVPQICAGLHFAHQHGIVHRDVKPENVLVDRDGRVRLADFGLAKLAGEPGAGTFTRSGEVFGTLHYMAPEQWQGSAGVDHRADIYALGVLLYELLTGRLPVGTYAPASRQPGVPPGVDPIVQRSLQHEPAERYQSARDVQHDLERERRAAAAAAGAAPVESVIPARRARAGRFLIAALAVLIVGGGVTGWFAFDEWSLLRIREMLRGIDDGNVELAAAIEATVARGEAWSDPVPRPLPPMRAGPLTEGVRTTVTIGGAVATLLATALLALVARRRTRAADTSRGIHVAAGFLMLIPVMLAASGLLGWYPALTRHGHSPKPALSYIAGLPIAVIVLWILWHTSGRRPNLPIAVAPVGWLTRVGLGAAALLGVYCVLLFAQAPRREPWAPTARLPATAAELVGLSRRGLLERLGPPRRIVSTPGVMEWNYRRLDATAWDAVFLSNGLVSGVATAGGRTSVHLLAERLPADGAFAGQTLDELTQVIGPPTSRFIGALEGTLLKFANGASATVNDAGVVTEYTR